MLIVHYAPSILKLLQNVGIFRNYVEDAFFSRDSIDA